MKQLLIFIILIALNTSVRSQMPWKALSSKSIDQPIITWYGFDSIDNKCLKVYRSSVNENNYAIVESLFYFDIKNDSLFAVSLDTSLIDKGIYKYRLQCAGKVLSETMFGHNLGKVPLPEVQYIKVDDVKNKTALRLSWKLSYKSTVTGIELYRSYYYDKGYKQIASLSNEDSVYIDYPEWPNEPAFYIFVLKDIFGQQRPTNPHHGIPTYDTQPFAPKKLKAEIKADSIFLSWTNISSNVQSYQFYIQKPKYESFELLRDLDAYKVLDNKAILKIDTSLAGTHRLYMTSRSSANNFSVPSDTVYFNINSTKAISPPISGNILQDSMGNNQIIWQFNPVDRDRTIGYNIYAQLTSGAIVKVNNSPIYGWLNYFTDTSDLQDIQAYLVKSLSADNTESEALTIINTNDNTPFLHAVLMLQVQGDKVTLSWGYSGGQNIYLYRKTNNEEVLLLKRISKQEKHYIDSQIPKGMNTYYITKKMNSKEESIISERVEYYKY